MSSLPSLLSQGTNTASPQKSPKSKRRSPRLSPANTRVARNKKINTVSTSPHVNSNWRRIAGAELEESPVQDAAVDTHISQQHRESVLNVPYQKGSSILHNEELVLKAPGELSTPTEKLLWETPPVMRTILSPMAKSPSRNSAATSTDDAPTEDAAPQSKSVSFLTRRDFAKLSESQKYSAYLRAMTLLSKQPVQPVMEETTAPTSTSPAATEPEPSPNTQTSNNVSTATTPIDPQKKQDNEHKMLQNDVEILKMRLIEREKELERVKSFLNNYVENPFGNPFFDAKSASLTLSSGLR